MYSNKILSRMCVGLASRPMPPEGRESILTYAKVNKSWVTPNNWIPTVDKFLEGITELHFLRFVSFASVLPIPRHLILAN